MLNSSQLAAARVTTDAGREAVPVTVSGQAEIDPIFRCRPPAPAALPAIPLIVHAPVPGAGQRAAEKSPGQFQNFRGRFRPPFSQPSDGFPDPEEGPP